MQLLIKAPVFIMSRGLVGSPNDHPADVRYLRLVALMWENENVLTFQRAEMRMIRWMCGIKLTDSV